MNSSYKYSFIVDSEYPIHIIQGPNLPEDQIPHHHSSESSQWHSCDLLDWTFWTFDWFLKENLQICKIALLLLSELLMMLSLLYLHISILVTPVKPYIFPTLWCSQPSKYDVLNHTNHTFQKPMRTTTIWLSPSLTYQIHWTHPKPARPYISPQYILSNHTNQTSSWHPLSTDTIHFPQGKLERLKFIQINISTGGPTSEMGRC